jgi:hypothetical protein
MPVNRSEMEEYFVLDAEGALAFLEKLPGKPEEMSDKGIGSFVTVVHGMKSSFANIGEPGLSAAALELEKAGAAKDFSTMAKKIPAFIRALRSVIEKYKPAPVGTRAPLSEEDKAVLREKLLIIKDACEKTDKPAAKAALSVLRERSWTVAVDEGLKEIALNILHSTFRKAASVAGELADSIYL